MKKLTTALLKWQMILLIVALALSLLALHPDPWAKGVVIRTVEKNSTADFAKIKVPGPTTPPMSREYITELAGNPINNVNDYYSILSNLTPDAPVLLKTNKEMYTVTPTLIDEEMSIGISVYDRPTTNLKKGLDLQGGTRVLLQPEKKLSKDEMDILLANMKERLNVFGLSDVVIREAGDLSGNQYVLIEIAGINEEEVKDLIAKQGKFDAKIGNDTVFMGGKDVRDVCRTAKCSGIDPQYGCSETGQNQWVCRFMFAITLSIESAQRQADLTANLSVVTSPGTGQKEYLESPLDLYLDDQLVDTLQIGKDLKGRAVTDIAISGSGVGATRQEAAYDSLKNMKRLQTILITGSLPVKMTVVKTDNLSPVLGDNFMRSIMIMALVSVLAVTAVLIISYRKLILALPIAVVMVSEIVILIGVAALIGWNIDMAAIAGIIVAVGTGVDDQIVITDESLRGRDYSSFGWKQKMKKAFFIIMAAYFCLVVAMLPLYFAGAGMLRGFAITTILGVSIGVFITRPAYAAIVEYFVKSEE